MAPSSERKPFPADLPEGLKPRLRLFLSVDLVGSTAFKQSRLAWLPAMLNFYRDFDQLVHSQYRAHRQRSNCPIPPPEFWKANGDELLYTCDLNSRDQAVDALNIWLATLNAYRSDLATLVEDLDVKSTAWIALFPAPNSEVFFRRAGVQFQADTSGDALILQAEMRDQWYSGQGRQDLTRDFVGPQVDTGFRLTSWSAPQRLMLSADLAYLLISSQREDAEPPHLCFSGRQTLRGVAGDAPYPMIWMPVGAGHKKDDGLNRDLSDPILLRAYCESIIEQNYKIFPPLFLQDGPLEDEGDYSWAPPFILNQIVRRWQDETKRREAA